MAQVLYKSGFQTFFDFLKILAAALLFAFIIRSFLIQPFIIPSESMLNTLQVGDRIFVTKFSYGIHLPFVRKEIFSTGEPKVGDIIVFPFPQNPSQDYIKRVVGVAGDKIAIRDKQLYRNGDPVREDFAIHTDSAFVPRRDNMETIVVPQDKVFVMGDNRDNSQDSRFWGFVDKDTVHGKAVVIYWSSTDWINIKWDRIGTLLR